MRKGESERNNPHYEVVGQRGHPVWPSLSDVEMCQTLKPPETYLQPLTSRVSPTAAVVPSQDRNEGTASTDPVQVS